MSKSDRFLEHAQSAWGQTDRANLSAVRRDMPEAWRVFDRRYRQLAWLYARRFVSSDHDAADVVQESLIAAYRRLKGAAAPFPPEKPFRFWLRRVIRNKARDHFRRRDRALPASLMLGPDEDQPDPIDRILIEDQVEDSTFEEALAQHVKLRAFESIAARTDPVLLAAAYLALFEERQPKEIARTLGLSAGDVSRAKHRVLVRLIAEGRRILEEERLS